MLLALRALLALAGAGAVYAGWPLRLAAQAAGRERLHKGFEAAALARGVTAPPVDNFYNNYVDHFDVTNEATYPQRFWVNTEFWNSDPASPVFLYVEGEGAGSPYSVLGGEHYELARTYGALILSLEHRYYGASVPVPDLTTPNLRFLSAHQAVADVARFLTSYVAPTYGVTFPTTRVVTFGGSYPGALSAWLRLRLPHLVSRRARAPPSLPKGAVATGAVATGAALPAAPPRCPLTPLARPLPPGLRRILYVEPDRRVLRLYGLQHGCRAQPGLRHCRRLVRVRRQHARRLYRDGRGL